MILNYEYALCCGFKAVQRTMKRAGLGWIFANAVAVGLVTMSARAEVPEFTLVIESHRFTPAELRVPAGQKIRLSIENRDATPEEFESYDFNREKIVPAKGRISLFVGPLKPGRYKFFGDFNQETARGILVVR